MAALFILYSDFAEEEESCCLLLDYWMNDFILISPQLWTKRRTTEEVWSTFVHADGNVTPWKWTANTRTTPGCWEKVNDPILSHLLKKNGPSRITERRTTMVCPSPRKDTDWASANDLNTELAFILLPTSTWRSNMQKRDNIRMAKRTRSSSRIVSIPKRWSRSPKPKRKSVIIGSRRTKTTFVPTVFALANVEF